MPNGNDVSLLAAGKALLVRFIYALNGIILTFYVYETIEEPKILVLNIFLLPSVVEVVLTLKYKKRGEWTWFIPSVFIYLLWVVPSIIVLEIFALDFRLAVVHEVGLTSCPIVFQDEYHNVAANFTLGGLTAGNHDLSRSYSMFFQQIMMLVIIFGRWMGPKGKLSRDQLSSLLLALTAMTVDMLEFSTDSLSINAVACDKVYVGFIIAVWCWSLLQIPLGLTAVKQRKPRVIGRIESRDSIDGDSESGSHPARRVKWRSYLCCCCESEIWALMVSMCMQDGPYLVLRLYIIFSAGYFGETLIFFAAKNAIIVMLQSYRVYVKVSERVCKNRRQRGQTQGHSSIQHQNGGTDARKRGACIEEGSKDATENNIDTTACHDDALQEKHGFSPDDQSANDMQTDIPESVVVHVPDMDVEEQPLSKDDLSSIHAQADGAEINGGCEMDDQSENFSARSSNDVNDVKDDARMEVTDVNRNKGMKTNKIFDLNCITKK